MTDSLVQVTYQSCDSGEIAHITLNRTDKRNAFDTQLLGETMAAFATASARDALRYVVLQSASDGVFSAGADVHEMATLDSSNAAAFIRRVHDVCQAIVDCPVPVVAVVDGVCVGAALEIVASCDLRLASDRARFSMPEVLVGLPSVVEAARLPQLIGFGKTRRLLYTGETINAAMAEQWGLVEYRCDYEQLGKAQENLLTQLLATAPQATRLQKSLIRQWELLDIDASIQAGVDAFEAAFKQPEAREWLSRQAASLTSNKL